MEKEYLEGDQTIPGQNYACVSFLSPNDVIKNKELYLFFRFMTQRCGEWEETIEKTFKDSTDVLKNKIKRDIKEKLQLELKYDYTQFKNRFESFTYKFHDDLDADWNKETGYQTSVRGVKIRGVYETLDEAEHRAQKLQKQDRSFHVFVGSVGQWLPWDPCADFIQKEEYLEAELNTLMKEYKKNEVSKNLFYEERKAEKMADHSTKKAREGDTPLPKEKPIQANMTTIDECIEQDDVWLQRKNKESENTSNIVEL